MLKKLILNKTQSHDKTVLTFSSDGGSITAIVGTTDSGKSSFIRALNYLFLLGPAYVRSGEQDMSVMAKLDNMNVMRSTEFSCDKKSSDIIRIDKDKWYKFGRKLPEGFSDLTKIFNLDIEDLNQAFSLNFISQYDQVLPKAMKPSRIAKLMGSMSGRNAVDSAIKETNVEIKRRTASIKSAEEINADLEERKDTVLAIMPDKNPDATEVIRVHKSLSSIVVKRKHLVKISSTIGVEKKLIDDLAVLHTATSPDTHSHELDGRTIRQEMDRLDRVVKIRKRMPRVSELDFKKLSEPMSKMNYIAMEFQAIRDIIRVSKNKAEIEIETIEIETALDAKQTLVNTMVSEITTLLSKSGLCPFSGEKLPENCKTALARGSATT